MNAASAVFQPNFELPLWVREMNGFTFTVLLLVLVVFIYAVFFFFLFRAAENADNSERRPDWLIPPTEKLANRRIAAKRAERAKQAAEKKTE
ncbi:hypothetical protein SARC_13892 [Sphaeroforma arctica JP610]|uniref:Uncharacterized protein n=1 Tax=Sphaeroforma arctica JP610 TaxID=667725 RepID=A0A0L0F9Z9_9EUKA|nr:hypothetical protein SARC_13892 [Sphaeroforma arctica JP610]KNC73549.1 hypothetical protein SARC_13892 [Sphaeroforma arctica JP610]|eukprot:XP_014147451.1 hypothetical protein SARC_13892 [Sphaeroforma arctica JP610]